MSRGHVHSMRLVASTLSDPVYACTSCSFRCTPRALATVEKLKHKHVAVSPTDPQATKVWDLTDVAS